MDPRIADTGLSHMGLALLAFATWACTSEPSPMSADATSSTQGSTRSCTAPTGLGRPNTIAEVVQLVNALPQPVTLPCFLESLDRPLALYATTSQASAQPATGVENPRLFIGNEQLIMSVVPTGLARHRLELAYLLEDRKSVKGELEFPMTGTVPDSAPYDQIHVGGGTTCGVCHDLETRYEEIDYASAFTSEVLQDGLDLDVPLQFVRQHALDCDEEIDAERCQLLTAVFAHGETQPWRLPVDSKICRSVHE